MTSEELNKIREWFGDHIRVFASPAGALHPFLQLKAEHSERVAQDARSLAQDMEWIPSDVNVAEAVGWLHDIGRFSQFAEFNTFSDALSVNHGERGWEIMRQSGGLALLSEREQTCILDGIRHHNSRTIPDHVLESESISLVQLIRDADKLDIFAIVHGSVRQDGFQALPNMLPQVKLDGPISPRLLHEIQTDRSSSLKNVHSLVDFLLMQLTWVYDINYSSTFRRIVERDIIANIARELPRENRVVDSIVQSANQFVTEGILLSDNSRNLRRRKI